MNVEDCLFCKIIKGEIPSSTVFENDAVYAFRDINPQMPTHVLLVPKKHVTSLDEAAVLPDADLLECIRSLSVVAKQEGLTGGYRVISNCGNDACQTVHHLHFHILGGGKMADRMA